MTNKNNKSDYFVKGEQHRLKYRYSLATSDFVKGYYKGCDKCQLALGIFYEYGIYVEQDYEKAVELWEKSSKQYQCTPPQNAEIFGDVDWPSEDEILQHLEKSFNDRIIDTADHDVVKRTLGLVI